MTRSRFLGGASPATPPSPATNNSEFNEASLNSDFIVILTALLCAVICILGLVAVARCAWMRRLSSNPPSPNKGLKKKELMSLPKQSYPHCDGPRNFTECAICLMEFLEGDQIRLLPQCGHGFHVGCIDTWLVSHSSCPSCRQTLVVTKCQNCAEWQPAPSFLP